MYFIRRGTDIKIWMEFLQPILAKIELICQQPTMPQLSGVHPSSGVRKRMAGGSQGGLAMYNICFLANIYHFIATIFSQSDFPSNAIS